MQKNQADLEGPQPRNTALIEHDWSMGAPGHCEPRFGGGFLDVVVGTIRIVL